MKITFARMSNIWKQNTNNKPENKNQNYRCDIMNFLSDKFINYVPQLPMACVENGSISGINNVGINYGFAHQFYDLVTILVLSVISVITCVAIGMICIEMKRDNSDPLGTKSIVFVGLGLMSFFTVFAYSTDAYYAKSKIVNSIPRE